MKTFDLTAEERELTPKVAREYVKDVEGDVRLLVTLKQQQQWYENLTAPLPPMLGGPIPDMPLGNDSGPIRLRRVVVEPVLD